MKGFRVRLALVLSALVGCGAVAAVVYARTAATTKGTVLTPQDYQEISQLYSVTYQGNDLGDQAQWLSGFADDIVFRFPGGEEVKGKKALADRLARGFVEKRADKKRRHWFTSIVIKPSTEGAIARAFFGVLDVSGKQAAIVSTGVMDDVFVKTRDGWKFKVHLIHTDTEL